MGRETRDFALMVVAPTPSMARHWSVSGHPLLLLAVLCGLGCATGAGAARCTPKAARDVADVGSPRIAPISASALDDFVRAIRIESPVEVSSTTLLMQTSCRCYYSPSTRTRLKLLSMMHVGTAGYFASLAEELRECDVVLSEGRNDDGFTPAEAGAYLRWVDRFQSATAKYLGLIRDNVWRASTRDARWRDVDLPLRCIDELIRDSGWRVSDASEAFVTEVESWLDATEEPEGARSDRAAFVCTELLSIKSPIEETMVDAARHNVILRELREVLDRCRGKTIAMLYGARHIAFLETTITGESGLQFVASSWHDVFECSAAAK